MEGCALASPSMGGGEGMAVVELSGGRKRRKGWGCSYSRGRGGARGRVEPGAAWRWDAHGTLAVLDSDYQPTWTVARIKMNSNFE
jgi:hypothetical protein